mmetsp:Transcript_5783/g.8135  ORF Transcript_5783/g.8135 Transcript_5783/m.8135 type:complete len:231 (-) Transcript_5783:1136-1828(-)
MRRASERVLVCGSCGPSDPAARQKLCTLAQRTCSLFSNPASAVQRQAVPQAALVEAAVPAFRAARGLRRAPQALQSLQVCLEETWLVVADVVLLAHLLHKRPGFAEVVTRKTGKKMMLNLKLEADVHPVQRRWSVKVHGGLQLCNVPLIVCIVIGMAVVRLHGEVRAANLNVQQAGHGMAHKEPSQRLGPGRQGQHETSYPGEVDGKGAQLRLSIVQWLLREELDERLCI